MILQGLKSNDQMILLQCLANKVCNTTPFAWQESLRVVNNGYLNFADNIRLCVLGSRKHTFSFNTSFRQIPLFCTSHWLEVTVWVLYKGKQWHLRKALQMY